MKKYEKEKNNPNQFIRKDGYDSFVEVLAPTPEFNKVTVQIVKYNKQTNKMVDSNSFFFTIPTFLMNGEWRGSPHLLLLSCHKIKKRKHYDEY